MLPNRPTRNHLLGLVDVKEAEVFDQTHPDLARYSLGPSVWGGGGVSFDITEVPGGRPDRDGELCFREDGY